MMTLQHKFVDHVPDVMVQGILYVSIPYCTAMHLCVCGCGNEVVTPISPTDWQLKFDGKSISLNPSIGNWNFECQCHYWIVKNEVRYAAKWDKEEIARGRMNERKRKNEYYDERQVVQEKALVENQKNNKKSIFEFFKSILTYFKFNN